MKDDYISFSDIQLSTGETLKELLVYEGIPTWWLAENLINIDLDVDIFRGKHIFKSIHLLLVNRCAPCIALSSFVSKLLYRLIDFITGVPVTKEKKSAHYLILTPISSRRWVKTGIINKHNYKLRNSYLDDIYSLLPSNIDILTSYFYYPVPDTFKQYYNIKKKYAFPAIALMNQWSWNTGTKVSNAISHFKKIYFKLENDVVWLEKVSNITGKSVIDILNVLKYHLTCLLPYRIEEYLLLDRMIAGVKPDKLVLTNEQSPMGRCWTYLGIKHRIPVIALQHGLILSDDRAYLHHNANDISEMYSIQNKSLSPFPIPNLTLVWGENDYDLLLTKAGYSHKQLEIVGNPRYDKLFNISNLYSKEVFCEKYGINLNDKLILWPTQSQGYEIHETIEYIHEIFTSVSEIDHITLIIKPHPVEDNSYGKIMVERLKSYMLNAVFMEKDSDTTEQIFVSDLVIMKNSTIGQEAVALHKPMIVLDYSENPDAGNFVKEGVAKGVYEKGILKDVILELLNDDMEQEMNRAAYIKKYMYKIDGKAAKRCADIITSFVAEDAK